MAELIDGQPLFPGDSDIDQLYIIQKLLGVAGRHQRDVLLRAESACSGPLSMEQTKLFLMNRRFAGFRFPDMSNHVTLESKYRKRIEPDALQFLKWSLVVSRPSADCPWQRSVGNGSRTTLVGGGLPATPLPWKIRLLCDSTAHFFDENCQSRLARALVKSHRRAASEEGDPSHLRLAMRGGDGLRCPKRVDTEWRKAESAKSRCRPTTIRRCLWGRV